MDTGTPILVFFYLTAVCHLWSVFLFASRILALKKSSHVLQAFLCLCADAVPVEVKKSEEPIGELGKKENGIPSTENKNAKKKKAKKDKPSKEAKDPLDHPNGSDNNTMGEATEEETVEEDSSAINVKERLKKMTSMKKKKASKERDAAAKAAAAEAAARTAKLLAAKKKEKNHYNQQPVR